MRTKLIYLALIFLFISCKNEQKLNFATKIYKAENCTNCPKITITVPQVIEESELSENINSSISKEIISILLYGETENLENYTVEKAIANFTQEHAEITNLHSDEIEPWEATIDGKISYEDQRTISVVLRSYIYSGGAHGYQSTQFLNFSKKTGEELKVSEIFKDKDAFKFLAENAFRKANNIPLDKNINSTGFMFEQDKFYLPENIGFTQEGIKLLYNQYEVASYADGPIEITLPYKEIQKYLKSNIKTEQLFSTTTFED